MAYPAVGTSSEHNGGLSPPLAPSDDDIKRQFDIPREEYIDKPGKRPVDGAWGEYLQSNDYHAAFTPLEDTESDRYRSIIEEVRVEERKTRRFALETFRIIKGGKPLILDGSQPYGDFLTLAQGVGKLDQYTAQESRHVSREAKFSKTEYSTKFGVFTACYSLPENPEDMFYVPELAGREDGDGPEWFDVVFEGVVPFNGRETYRRFTRDAFPAFLRMAIAAVGFDPRDENHGAHAWAAQVEHARTAGFAELPERERANLLKLLRRIWQVKYGTKRSQYPGFLNAQLAKSMSRLREMGWLMTKIERDAHQHAGHHYWTHCRGLLKDITGRDAASLADEYCAITLAREAETLMDSGDVGHILFYKLGQEYRGTQKLEDVYNSEGPVGQISLDLREINELCDKAIKTLYDRRSRPRPPLDYSAVRGPLAAAESSVGSRNGLRPQTSGPQLSFDSFQRPHHHQFQYQQYRHQHQHHHHHHQHQLQRLTLPCFETNSPEETS
ncbi:hypothetical protein F5B18DRAFT_646886 [Nemania serpens]|nr:hypothetical protein F5B18DRAFT_646886 [Nemania serpens]